MPIDFLNMTQDELFECYGLNWQVRPIVYLSGGLAAGDREAICKDHSDIICKLAPNFIGVSPLRGIGHGNPRPGDPFYADHPRDNEVRTRDLYDVERARVILLNVEPMKRHVDIIRLPDGRTKRKDYEGSLAASHELITTVEEDAPFTGTVCEIFHAAYALGKPVVAYNWNKRGKQSKVWFEPWITRAFDGVDAAIKYLNENWSY